MSSSPWKKNFEGLGIFFIFSKKMSFCAGKKIFYIEK
jgi:hypothetical protein